MLSTAMYIYLHTHTYNNHTHMYPPPPPPPPPTQLTLSDAVDKVPELIPGNAKLYPTVEVEDMGFPSTFTQCVVYIHVHVHHTCRYMYMYMYRHDMYNHVYTCRILTYIHCILQVQ